MVLGVARCGTARPPRSDARYGTVEDLRDAAVAAGFECKRWKQTNLVATAAESGECGRDSVFATFASEGDLQEQIEVYRDVDKLLGKDASPRLVGPNWIINSPEAPELQPELGGTVENG